VKKSRPVLSARHALARPRDAVRRHADVGFLLSARGDRSKRSTLGDAPLAALAALRLGRAASWRSRRRAGRGSVRHTAFQRPAAAALAIPAVAHLCAAQHPWRRSNGQRPRLL